MERQRLDKWLWHARVVKARTSAAELVERGYVRINGARETSPGHAVKEGDVLTIALDRTVRVKKVIGFSERRGDATDLKCPRTLTFCPTGSRYPPPAAGPLKRISGAALKFPRTIEPAVRLILRERAGR